MVNIISKTSPSLEENKFIMFKQLVMVFAKQAINVYLYYVFFVHMIHTLYVNCINILLQFKLNKLIYLFIHVHCL